MMKEFMYLIESSNMEVFMNFAAKKEKKHFSVEMIFNIYENDFKDKVINDEINSHLLVYDYCYSLINNE